jgi:predicted DNA-binding protein
MTKTLTIRLGRAESEALARRAKTLGKTRSAVVRELLVDALVERPLAIKAGHLRGRLAVGRRRRVSWREDLKARNWRS